MICASRGRRDLCVFLVLLIASSSMAFGQDETPLSSPEQSLSFPLASPPPAVTTERKSDDLEQTVEHARTLMLQGKLDEARAILESLLRQTPEQAKAWHWLGMIELQQQQTAEGISALERSVQLAPGDQAVKFDLAAAYEAANRPAEAERLYQGMLGEDADGIEARFRLGRLYSLAGHLDQAIDAFEKVQAAKDRAPARARAAAAQLDGLYTRKAQALMDALEHGESDAFSKAVAYGIAQAGKQRLDDAQHIFETVIKIFPKRAPGYYWLSRVQISRGQLTEGVKSLARASELAPDNFRVKMELAKAYDAAKQLDDAQRTFKDIIDHAQEPALVKEARSRYGLLRARKLFQVKDWAGALVVFETLLKGDPADPRLLELKAQALEELGRHAEADAVFSTLLERFPDNVALRSRVAGAYERRGDTGRAREQYVRILQLQQTGEQARLALDRLGLNRGSELLQKNQPVEALKIFESVLAIDPEVPAANLGAGIAYHRLKLNAEAEAAFKKVLAVDPNNLVSWVELAQIYEATGRTEEASSAFEKLERFARSAEERKFLNERLGALYKQEVDRVSKEFKSGATDTAAVISLGERLVRRGFNEEAIKLLNVALERAPNDERLHLWLGKAYMGLDKSDRGLAEIERAARLAPGNYALLMELAEDYVHADRFEDAERILLEVIRRADDDGLKRQAGRSLGLLRIRRLLQDKDYAEALAEYDKLLLEFPDDPQLMSDRGRVLVALGRREEAEAVFARLLELAPDNINIRLGIAEMYRQLKEPERAEPIYTDLLERNPSLAAARFGRARLYQETGRDFDALKDYGLILRQLKDTEQGKQVLTLAEGLTRQMIQRGIGLVSAKKLDEALSLYARMAEIQPNNVQIPYLMSQIYKQQGRFDLQVQKLEKVVELQPDNIAMKRRIAFAYVDAGNTTKASEVLHEVLKEFPYDSEMRLALGDLLEREGQHEQAHKEYVTLLQLNPAEEWRAKALDRLGLDKARAQAGRGETSQAIATVQEVLEIVPDDPIADGVLAKIYQDNNMLKESEAAWGKVLAAKSDDRDARLSLARIYAETSREAVAIKEYYSLASEEALTTQRDDARKELDQLLVKRANALIAQVEKGESAEALKKKLLSAGIESFNLGGLDAAQKIFDYMVKQFPDSAESLYWMGRVYAERKQFSDGLVFMKRSVDLAPQDPRFLLGLGQAYNDMEIFEPAKQTLEKARDLAPENVDIRITLAGLYQRRGDMPHAEGEYAHALEYALDGAAVRRVLDALGLPDDPKRLSETELKRVLRLFENMMSGPPRSVSAKYYVAVVYQRQRRYVEAEAEYQSVLSQDESHAGASLHLARLYAETGRLDQAITLLEKAVGRGSERPMQQELQKQLSDFIVSRAENMTTLLRRGEGDVHKAKELSKKLMIRGEADAAAALMEVAVKVAPNDAEANYLFGRAQVDRGKLEAGIAALERSVKLAPADLQIVLRQQLANAYERAGRFDEAIALHRDLLQRAPNEQLRRQARMRLAMASAKQLIRQGNNDAALQEYNTVLRLFPDEVSLLIEQGQLLAKMGRTQGADRTFEHVLKLAPDNLMVHLRLAQTYNERGDKEKMVPQATAVIRSHPFTSEAQQAREMLGYDRAVELIKSGSLEDAQDTLERILTVIPKDPVTRFDLGRIYFQQKKYAEAERMLGKLIRDYPDHQDAHFLLGDISRKLERRESAIAEYERAVALGRQTVTGQLALKGLEELYRLQVQEQIAAGQDEAAILGLNKQIRNDPANVAARANLVVLYSRKQKYDEALQQLREMARLQPNNQRIYAQMGSLYAATQRNVQAVEAYASAISLETDEGSVNRDLRLLITSLSQQLLDNDKSFAAIRELTMLNDMGLGNDRANFILGVIYRQQNRYAEAASAFRDAVRANPNNLLIRLNLAQLYEITNDYDLALLQYRQILRLGKPGDRIVEAARPRADALKNRLALFNSRLQYGMTIGNSNIEEQDISNTGAINSNFSSTLVYNLGTNFWPAHNLNIRLDTGALLVTNHSTQTDTFVPNIGLSGNLNYPDTFYSASAMVSEIRSLMLETSSGRTFDYSLTAGLRLRDTFDLLSLWRRKKSSQFGETAIERISESQTAVAEVVAENKNLRSALQEVYRQLYPSFTVKQPDESIRTYKVARGDSLWDIASRFFENPFRWRELDQLNPQIVNPDLIYPGDLIFLEPPQSASLFQKFDAEMMLQRDEDIRKSVGAAMDLYTTGQTLMRQDKLGEALKFFDLVLDIVPDDTLTLFNVGIIYQRQHEFDLAEQAFRKALSADPENQSVRLHLADIYEESGRIDKAILMDEEALRHTLSERERQTASAQLRKLYRRKADAILGKTELSKGDADALLELSKNLLDMQSPVAEILLKELLGKRPNDAEANFHLAQLYLQLNKPKQSLEFARNSVKLAPDNARYLLTLARAARANGNYSQAEAVYRGLAGSEADASAAVAQHELEMTEAERLEVAGKLQEARGAYVRLVEENPEDVSLMIKVASLSDQLNLLDDSVKYYTRAIALEPKVLDYRLALVDVYSHEKQNDKAREQLIAAKGIAQDAEERQAILDHLGFQEALANFRRDKPGKALEYLRDIESVMPDNALVQLNIGVAYQRQEKYPEAEAQFQKILDTDAGNLNALLRLGMVYAESGRVDRAITVYERVIAQGRGLTVSERAQAELQGLEKRRLRTLTGVDTEPSEPLIKTLQGRLFASTSTLPGRSLSQTDTWGAGATYYYPTVEHGDWIFNYTFNFRNNVDPLGADYSFYSHDIGLTWQTPMPNFARWLSPWFGTEEYIPGLTASLGLDHEMRFYRYFDTNYLNIFGKAQRRRQTVSSLTAGFTYRFPNIDQMSLYLNYTRGRTRANLPVGIVFSPEGVPVAFQSSGLGDFDPNFASLGFAFQF